MANKLYEESYIQDIADAIREKNGTSTIYKVSQMGAAVRALEGNSEISLVDSGTCGESATWEFFSDGNLVISGTGALDCDWLMLDEEDIDWSHLENQVIKIIVNEGITDTGSRAFLLFSSSLTEVELPSSLVTIGTGTFQKCSKLTNITLPNNVTTIGDYAFNRCGALTSIIIPDNVTSIGQSAFSFCNNLKSVTIGSGVLSIGQRAFSDSGISNITIPDNVADLGVGALQSCSNLKSVILGTGLTKISDSMFIDSRALKTVIIPKSVVEIEASAFVQGNAATGQDEPIDLSEVYYSGTKNEWDSIVVASGNDALSLATLCCEYMAGEGGASTLEERSITITSNGTTEILPSEGHTMSKVTVDVNVPTDGATDEVLMSVLDGSVTEFTIPSSFTKVRTGLFYGCEHLSIVNIPEGITRIESDAFDACTSLQTVQIPSTVTDIGSYAFYYCTSLNSVTFNGTPSKIATSAFGGCSNLTTINVPWAENAVANAPWGATKATINYNYQGGV